MSLKGGMFAPARLDPAPMTQDQSDHEAAWVVRTLVTKLIKNSTRFLQPKEGSEHSQFLRLFQHIIINPENQRVSNLAKLMCPTDSDPTTDNIRMATICVQLATYVGFDGVITPQEAKTSRSNPSTANLTKAVKKIVNTHEKTTPAAEANQPKMAGPVAQHKQPPPVSTSTVFREAGAGKAGPVTSRHEQPGADGMNAGELRRQSTLHSVCLDDWLEEPT